MVPRRFLCTDVNERMTSVMDACEYIDLVLDSSQTVSVFLNLGDLQNAAISFSTDTAYDDSWQGSQTLRQNEPENHCPYHETVLEYRD